MKKFVDSKTFGSTFNSSFLNPNNLVKCTKSAKFYFIQNNKILIFSKSYWAIWIGRLSSLEKYKLLIKIGFSSYTNSENPFSHGNVAKI